MAKTEAQPERPRAEWVPNYHQRKYAAEQAAHAAQVKPAARKKAEPEPEASAGTVHDTTRQES